MESTDQLLRKFQKRELTPEPSANPKPASKEAQFVPIRRRGLAADSADTLHEVSQEALLDEEGLVGLSG